MTSVWVNLETVASPLKDCNFTLREDEEVCDILLYADCKDKWLTGIQILVKVESLLPTNKTKWKLNKEKTKKFFFWWEL